MSAVVKITFYVSAGFFWKKNLFETFKVLSSFLNFVQDVLSLSVGKKWNACQNSNQSIYTEDQITLKIEEKWKNPKLFKFLVLTAVSSLRKTFGRLVKSVPILSTVTFWGKVFFVKIYFFPIWDFECKLYALWQNKLSEVVQTLCTCPECFLAEVFFYQSFWKFLPFLYFKQKVLSIWWKPGRLVNSAFYMWRTAFWGKIWKIHNELLFSYLPRKNVEESLADFSKL